MKEEVRTTIARDLHTAIATLIFVSLKCQNDINNEVGSEEFEEDEAKVQNKQSTTQRAKSQREVRTTITRERTYYNRNRDTYV